MRKLYVTMAVVLMAGMTAFAQNFETATDAVANMGLGWNLGNTLESNAGDTTNMWIEMWGATHTPADYENAWGQVPATRELIHMFREAGFGAIRVPVTWYPHMGVRVELINNKPTWKLFQWQPTDIDSVWMARVKEVVDYVIDEGMYCILNVHHDTGAANTGWIRASMENYNRYHETFESIWTQVATTFRDYDEHLVFEGYNEMLDKYSSWCFASFSAPSNYNATAATDAYNAINSYAQSFVNAVRATGGNNMERNLVISTYGACSGLGTWSTHLQEPLTRLTMPTDPCGNQNHLMVEFHTYPSIQNNGTWMTESQVRAQNTAQVNVIQQHIIQAKGYPVICGEWGTSNVDAQKTDYEQKPALYLAFVRDFIAQCKDAGIGTFYWMGLSDGADRAVPRWSQPAIKDAMVQAFNGSTAIVDTEAEQMGEKIVRNGRVLIVRDGVVYDLLGRKTDK